MVLTVSFALSLVTGLCCHHRQAELAPPNLTPASGRQDHTTSPSASSAFRQARYQRPPHLLPNDRDDRDTPLSGSRPTAQATDLRPKKAEYFWLRGWTGRNSLIAFRNLTRARRPQDRRSQTAKSPRMQSRHCERQRAIHRAAELGCTDGSNATKQSTACPWLHGLLRVARNDSERRRRPGDGYRCAQPILRAMSCAQPHLTNYASTPY
jgi:hypothetical protein